MVPVHQTHGLTSVDIHIGASLFYRSLQDGETEAKRRARTVGVTGLVMGEQPLKTSLPDCWNHTHFSGSRDTGLRLSWLGSRNQKRSHPHYLPWK